MKGVQSASTVMAIKAVAIISLVTVCAAFERDENYYNNENESYISLFSRNMKLSDYKKPTMDSPGFLFAII
jgi:hypothetical protein